MLSVTEFDYNRWDLPPASAMSVACLWHPPRGPDTSEWLRAVRSEQPWVHVTEGTSHFQDPFVLPRAAVRGTSRRPVRGDLSRTGASGPAEELAPVPLAANIHLARAGSATIELLPRCAALVTTGGAGTTMAGLRAGVPLVVVPTTWDKPDNARRVAEAGAGVICARGDARRAGCARRLWRC